ncbi:MAG: hypothetical protein WDN03_15515 [Rhizomicrobium sp.]
MALSLAWDQDYQLTGIAAASGGTTIQDLAYGYDASGNVTAITDHLAGSRSQPSPTTTSTGWPRRAGSYGALAFTYDGVGNRLTRTAGATTDTYAYPSTSNRLSSVTTGANARSFSYAANGSVSDDTRDPSNDYAYSFNNAARLTTAS